LFVDEVSLDMKIDAPGEDTASLHFAKHTSYAHTKYASKHAKLTEVEPTIHF